MMLEPKCPTGFCDYERYQSLSISSICEDMSDKVELVDELYVLPPNRGMYDELSLDPNDGLINSTVSFRYLG